MPRLSILTLGDGKVTELELVMAVPLAVIGDQFVYVSPSGGLMAVPFDNRAHRPKGDPVQLDDGLLMDWTAGAKASLSASGTIAYLRGRAQFLPVRVNAGDTLDDSSFFSGRGTCRYYAVRAELDRHLGLSRCAKYFYATHHRRCERTARVDC